MADTRKKTILIVIQRYLPGTKTGGPVRSIYNLVEWLGDEFDFRIVTLDRDSGDTEPYPDKEPGRWYMVGKGNVRYLAPHEAGILALRRIIHAIPHDVLHLESVLAATSIKLLLLRRLGMVNDEMITIAPRGHLGAGALRQKSFKKQVFLRLVQVLNLYRGLVWSATSDGERTEIIRYFGKREANRIHVLPNLPTRAAETNTLSSLTKLSGHLQIIFLSRISRKKNLHFALETLRHITGSVVFDIYGPLEDERYWSECQTVIEQLPSNVQVKYCGVVPFEQTNAVMSQYDLFFLSTLHENYGHAIFEALSAGCPVLISDQTPWEGLEAADAGWVIALDNQAGFVNVINLCVEADHDTAVYYRRSAQRYAEQYVRESMQMEQFRALFGIK